jgi:hypothetical protein
MQRDSGKWLPPLAAPILRESPGHPADQGFIELIE